ncbi:tetratricopeptide repeat protein [Micromonospora sp. ATCC 39149]|uniref:Tetratricopeptide repeat protein n=1 Tax=Micromonospora carbonacea TaxID=47853 RepID=A0A7D5YC62_9ACTN|nr:tetratricopeptide repeat protein [Micromonospora sp. ATCC 39149]QLJ96355.1 tetratricopeptide repeat protein [Micromonospora carbonacea]
MTRWWGPAAGGGQTVTGSVVFGDIVQISGVGGDVTVSLDRPWYRVVPADDAAVPLSVARARAQPSRLLLARHQIVPFTGRERTLDVLAAWVGGDAPVAVLLVHGAGGQGKTRLAAQVTVQCAAAGWAVWQVTHLPVPVVGAAGVVSQVELPGGAVLAVVDYADRWPASALLALLTQLRDLHARAGTRVRVLMLARSDGYWWPALADRADGDLGVEVDQLALAPLAADSGDDRPGLFTTAAARFASALGLQQPAGGWPVPELTADGFGQVLAVHMTALAAVDAAWHGEAPPTGPGSVSAYLLRREQAYWQHLHTRAEAPIGCPPEVMHRVVVAATLTGAQPRPAARQALERAGFADTGAAADRIIDDHTTCYPPADTRTVFEPLHPDRLGEDLIAMSTPGHGHPGITRLERDWTSELITGLLTGGPRPPAWAAAAVTVLVETGHRWPHLATGVLYPLIREHPQVAIAVGGSVLTRLAGIPGIDPTILEALEPLLPANRHTDLDIAAAAITSTLTRHRLVHTTDPAEQARLHATHAWRLANAGLREQALTPAEEATGIYRRLAEANPDAYLPNLAASLNNLGIRLSELGRRQEALGPSQEAAGLYRRLVEVNPDAYLPDLAMSLNNLGIRLSELGRRQEALAPAEEAVTIRRRLVEVNPDAYLPDLAMSLNNLGTVLSELGRRQEALGPSQEAAGLYRRLVEVNPDAYLPDLAMSLNNLGIRLFGLGRRQEALAPAEEAVTIRRRLVEVNPDAYLPDLAMSLNNLGTVLSELGRRQEALGPSQESVTIRRRLAEVNPDAYLPNLAMSLNNLGAFLSELGRRQEALAPAEEAVTIRRRLVEVNPDAYLPDLAMSLNNLGIRLSELGRRQEALGPSQEAVGLYRRLVEVNPDAYLPDLAMSLNNLGIWLLGLGRRQEALGPSQEAVGLYRRLVEVNPDAYLPDLAMSLNNLGTVLSGLGRRQEALAPAEEATGIYRRLAEVNPDAYLPYLAMSLWAYAWVCVNVQANLPQALESVAEAIGLYQPLAQQLPQLFAGRLLAAYRTLADVLDGLGRADEATELRRQLAEATGDRPDS